MAASGAAEKDSSDSILAEWATSLCQHLQTQRPSAPISQVLPRLLGPSVERHLRTIIDSAVKIQRRGKRSTLSVDDINFALELAKEECVYGYSSSKPNQITRWDGKDEVHWIPENDVNLTEMFQTPLPSAPIAPSFSLHWLAVDGVQPEIAQNPSKKKLKSSTASSSTSIPNDQTDNHTMVSHVLSHEMQLLFGKVTESLKSGILAQQKAVLASVAMDSGLQELMPYFSQFIQTQVSSNLKNLPLLQTMMELLRCLLNNPHVHIELYLHQIIPALLTCIVGKKLCNDPYTDDHWSLRDLASSILASVCSRFSSMYSNLQPRITKALFDALALDKPMTTRYGAIVAISKLGALCIKLLLLPSLSGLESSIEKDLMSTQHVLNSRVTGGGGGKGKGTEKTKNGKSKNKNKSSSSDMTTNTLKSDMLKSSNALRCQGALLSAMAILISDIDVGGYIISISNSSLTSSVRTIQSSIEQKKTKKMKIESSSTSTSTSQILHDRKHPQRDGLSMMTNSGRRHSISKRLKSKNKLLTQLSQQGQQEGEGEGDSKLCVGVGVPSDEFGDALIPFYIKSLAKATASPALLFI